MTDDVRTDVVTTVDDADDAIIDDEVAPSPFDPSEFEDDNLKRMVIKESEHDKSDHDIEGSPTAAMASLTTIDDDAIIDDEAAPAPFDPSEFEDDIDISIHTKRMVVKKSERDIEGGPIDAMGFLTTFDDDAITNDELAPAPFDPSEFEDDIAGAISTKRTIVSNDDRDIEEGPIATMTVTFNDTIIYHEAASSRFDPMEFEDDRDSVHHANYCGSHSREGVLGQDDSVNQLIVDRDDSPRQEVDSITHQHAAAADTAVDRRDSIYEIIIPEAFVVDDEESVEFVIATPLEKDRPWWEQRRTRILVCTVFVLVITLAITLGITLGAFKTQDEIEPPLHKEEHDSQPTLGDWAECETSSECNNGCCSAKHSDGVLKCTPFDDTEIYGGYRPDICTGDPPTPGNWTLCETSSECNSGCCSDLFSGGIFKCTPISREPSVYSCS
jgi:hypothetical protein